MKISRIEYENFRNFKDHGEITCSTDGKVTIIYGKNGDGKTTLHQLFQWVLYGHVHFNKTTTDRLYNLQYERELSFGDTFRVMGCIDFEHGDGLYSVRRTFEYKKGVSTSSKIAEDFTLSKMDDDYNWHRLDRPKDTIEKLLPSGLSDYFFFDGESMIADLRVKGKDSAGKLRKALFSMFDLDVIEAALDHIGRTDLRTTVLGKLYLGKGTISSGSEISALKTNIENAQNKLDRAKDDLREAQERKQYLQEELLRISELIGGTKSKEEYERQRRILVAQRDQFLKNASQAQVAFGDAVFDAFPSLLISKAVNDAKQRIQLKVAENKLPDGVTKTLVQYLLKPSTHQCICGNPLCEAEIAHLRSYISMLPPHSYTMMYQQFSQTALRWQKQFDKDVFDQYITSVLDNEEQASKCDSRIRDIDEEQKKSADIEELVVERQKGENELTEIDARIEKTSVGIKKLDIYLKKQMELFDAATRKTVAAQRINVKISIMEKIAQYFSAKLNNESIAYSQKLEANIQNLIDCMLTSKRKVSVTPEFSVRVTDSFNDESKSEGQFAVVSFAYIGGILKMLKEEERLSSKEYPLVLDGPFSKLDPDQRQNVVNIIPRFAPQVILLSKDDLHEVINKEDIGNVWTIVSNEEKNVAHIEEGHLWK